MTDWTFHPTLVAPFYLQLMAGNIGNTALVGEDERRRLLAELRARAAEVTDSQLHEMLASSWRPSLVATWFITYLRKLEFRAEIEAMLMKRPANAQHLCICLSQFGGESAAKALLNYLRGCAAGTIQSSPMDEAVTPEWALCAVEYLGWDEGIERAVHLWDEFLEAQRRASSGNRYTQKYSRSFVKAWEDRLMTARQAHARVMEILEDELKPDDVH